MYYFKSYNYLIFILRYIFFKDLVFEYLYS